MDTPPRQGILAGGLWLIDSTKHIDRYPEPSRLATVSEVVRSNGGGAFNVLVDLARLGAEFPLRGVGRIGDDENGDWIEGVCRNHKIDTTGLRRIAGLPTAGTDVMTEAGSGRRTFFYLPGANVQLGREDFPLHTSCARVLYLGYPGLLPALDRNGPDGRTGVAALLAAARERGFTNAVDLVSADPCDWAGIAHALPQVDLLFANEWEAARLLGEKPVSEEHVSGEQLQVFGSALLKRGVRQAVVVHSSRGAVCVSSDGASARRGAVQVAGEEIRGTCGAGDALAAGFLLGFHRGETWGSCLELAVCAAATCLHDLTSSQGVRRWDECLAYGRGAGFRKF